jgi:nitrogen fixation protein NifU and related proteins
MNQDLRELYQDIILDHSKHPRNFGKLAEANRQARGNNPLCGDRITLALKLDGDRIAEAKFEARGCAISVASASMMTDMVKGKTVEEARALFEQFHGLVTGKPMHDESDDLDRLAALSGVRDFPSRIKCATLPWHALTAALAGTQDEVRTE